MKFSIHDPRFTVTGAIACVLTIDGRSLPFSASPDDPEPLGREVFAAALEMDPSPYDGPSLADLEAAEAALRPVGAAAMRIALHRLGRLQEVEGIAASDPEAQILWKHSTVFRRSSALIEAMGTGAGWTVAEIDALFRAARDIEAGG